MEPSQAKRSKPVRKAHRRTKDDQHLEAEQLQYT